MPIHTPVTWNVADTPTHTILNARIRDGINGLKALPLAVLRKTANQSISSGVHTAVTWNAEDVDSDGGHSTVSATERYTAQTAGWYYLTATVVFGGNANGRRDAYFRVNGDTSRRWGWNTQTPTTDATGADICMVISTHLHLDVGDWVEAIAHQDSGGALNVLTSNQDSRFQIMWVAQTDGDVRPLPDPKTWAPGIWSVAEMNVQMRDAEQFFLQPPLCIVRKDQSPQTLPPFSSDLVIWDTVVRDNNHFYDSSKPTRLTAQLAGYYLFTLQLQWLRDPVTDEPRYHRVQLFNQAGTVLETLLLFQNDMKQTNESYTSSAIAAMNAGDYAVARAHEFAPTTNQLAELDPSSTQYGCQMDMRWVSAL
ncbi:MAG TPA: hypothetical protein VFV66_28545 [Nonomuraea sp.]|nr:hypothetical protein [Nonomuraea sp.]